MATDRRWRGEGCDLGTRIPIHVLDARCARTSAQVGLEDGEEDQVSHSVGLLPADGGRIYRFYEAWREACKAAGIDRIPHDFRRTAVRNLERAGVPRTTAMAMIGHKTVSIYRRYSIVDQAMLEMGTSKLEALQQTQRLTRSKLVSMPRRRS